MKLVLLLSENSSRDRVCPRKNRTDFRCRSHRLGGLSIGYDAQDTVSATAIDELVLAMNRARLVPNKVANLPLTFYADSACSLKVSLLSSTSSGDITMGA